MIADNCGTSVRMIEKTYAKILAEKRRDFIERGAPSFRKCAPATEQGAFAPCSQVLKSRSETIRSRGKIPLASAAHADRSLCAPEFTSPDGVAKG